MPAKGGIETVTVTAKAEDALLSRPPNKPPKANTQISQVLSMLKNNPLFPKNHRTPPLYFLTFTPKPKILAKIP